MMRSIAKRKAIAAIFTAAWSIFGAQSGYGQPPIEEGKIYWAEPERGIHRSSLDGSNVEQLVIPELRRPGNIALDVAGGKMYWTDRRRGRIHWSDLDGSNISPEGIGWKGVIDIALDISGGKVYWTEGYSDFDTYQASVIRANLDGSNIERLTDYVDHPRGIALDLVKGKIYWVDWGWNKICRANLDGSNLEDVVTELGIPRDIALDVGEGKIYWTKPWERTIQRSDLNGANVEDVLTELAAYPADLALDLVEGKIYWTIMHDVRDYRYRYGEVQRANLDGSAVETVVEWGGTIGIALDLDSRKIYWSEVKGTIQRADLDGSNAEYLFDPIVRSPYGIALDADRGKMYWSDLVVGSIHQSDIDGSSPEVLVPGIR